LNGSADGNAVTTEWTLFFVTLGALPDELIENFVSCALKLTGHDGYYRMLSTCLARR